MIRTNSTRLKRSLSILTFLVAAVSGAIAQLPQPIPGTPKTGQIPFVNDTKLKNGLTVAVGERKSTPLVTILLLVKSAAGEEDLAHAGLANLTASLLIKGTKTRTATQIAEEIEFLGGSINSGAGWNNSTVSVTVASDKVERAAAILADVVLDPAFKQDELDLLRSQTLDGLTFNLKQPGFLASYVSGRYSYGEHPAGGTPESLTGLTRDDVLAFHKLHYVPDNSVLIFTGDIANARANAVAQKYFGAWKANDQKPFAAPRAVAVAKVETALPKRILVVDLPSAGQAAVRYSRKLDTGRVNCNSGWFCITTEAFFPGTLMNSLLGGGYSSRMNLEIRIKRGLSYGAFSGISWRGHQSNFFATAQTKSESAAEVASVLLDEIEKLGDKDPTAPELEARKLVLSGDFGRDLETTGGLASRIAELYSFDLRPALMNTYIRDVRSVTGEQIRDFTDRNIRGGDIVIVGDSKLFIDDLKKRFPKLMINTITSERLDLSKDNLQK